MASIHDCLQAAVKEGQIDQAHANEAKSEYDQLVERYAQAMPIHQAEATAALHLKEATRKARRSRRHMVLNQLQSMVRIRHQVESSARPEQTLRAMLDARGDDAYAGESVATMRQAILARVRNDLRDLLKDTRINALGNSRDLPLLQDVIREAHGQSTGSEIARRYAEALERVQEWERQMFNAYGGDIGKIENYGVRHSHDGRAVREAGFDTWSDDVFGELDWSRITDARTGQPFAAQGALPSRAEAEPFLRSVYASITTDGWATREPAMSIGAKALYNRHAEARQLHFRNGDAWLGYNDKYGRSDPFSAMVGGLEVMARDIALMRVLGPNPNMGLEYAIQVATKKAQTSGNQKLVDRVKAEASRAKTLLAHTTGAANVAEWEALANFTSAVRHVNVATKLGAATLSAVGDLHTISVGALAMNMNPLNFVGRAVKNVASSASREEAARMGFVAESVLDMHTSTARLTSDVVSNDIFSRMSQFTIRASGLSYWTDAMRLSVQMETAGHLAGQAGRSLGEIDPMLRGLLERNGITPADWDLLRAPEGLYTARNGGTFLSPFWWLEHQNALPRMEAEGLALRLQAAIQDQMETFVPSRRVRGSARWLGDSKPGTLMGELARSSVGFKNYAVSLTIGQIALWHNLPSPMARVRYLAANAAAAAIFGALVLQFKEIKKGNDPRPMDDHRFWGAALLQSGGLGIFGDFLFGNTNRFGSGWAETLAGPTLGTLEDAGRVLLGNAGAAWRGENTHLGRDVANFVRYNTPVASSLWYMGAAYDRIVADTLQSMLDPEAEAAWRRQVKSRERKFGTQPFWPRGRTLPDRAPDLSNAIGGRP